MKRSKYQIRLICSVLNLVALLQPITRPVLSITNDRNMEQQPAISSCVVTATKTLHNKVIEIIRSSLIKIRTKSRDYVEDNKILTYMK